MSSAAEERGAGRDAAMKDAAATHSARAIVEIW